MRDVALQAAKNEMQHVVKMHADVGGDAEGFARIAFPAFGKPLAARGDVGQIDIKLAVLRGGGHFVAQLADGAVVAQLQDVEDALAGVFFYLRQLVEQFRGRYQRLFADHVAVQAQTGGNVRVVQVVGRADGDVVERGVGAALERVGKILEAFKLGEKFTRR